MGHPIDHGRLSLRPGGVAAKAACLLLALCGAAHAAGWQWLDESGHRVFSDRAPPPSVPEKNIVQRPGPAPGASGAETLPASAPSPAPVHSSPQTPAVRGQDQPRNGAEVERQLRDSAAAEAERLAAQERRSAQIRRENCDSARSRLTILLSGVRLMATNAQGEPAAMDDAMRAQELRRLRQYEQENCSPGASRPAQ